MWIGLVTLFPTIFRALSYGITGRAQQQGILELTYWNPRDYTRDPRQTIDDRPYGGGPGMVMMVEPLRQAITAAQSTQSQPCHVIHLTPQGRLLTQEGAQELARRERLILIAGRYEGIDERLIPLAIHEEWSIGDYVLTGGELAAMVMIDTITRLLPRVLGDEASIEEESFKTGLLDYPHYTRPEEIEGLAVPKILLSGDHAAILRWRKKQALGRTWLRRPDLIKKKGLSATEKELLNEFLKENQHE